MAVLRTLLLAMLLAATNLAADPPDTRRKPPPATPEQQKAAQALLGEFRKARTTEARLPLIAAAGELHPGAVKLLADVVTKELARELAAYRQQYMKIAAGLAGNRVTPEAVAEAGRLRARILAVRDRENLTRAMIEGESDPALARLKELLLVERSAVLEKSPELARRREALLLIGQQWEACARLLVAASDDPPPAFDAYLQKEEEIGTVLASPMDAGTRQVLAANAQLSGQLDPEEARCMLDLNMTRILIGLPPLAIDPALVRAARDHSQDMERLEFFAHESPVPGKRSFVDRAARFNTTAGAENIFAGAVEGASANRGWWHSPGHHRNLLGDHRRVGVGRAGRMWTEMFGG